MLASLLAVPVSAIAFDPTPTVQLRAVSFTEGKYPTAGAAVTEIAAGDKVAIEISVSNTSSETLNLSGFRLEFTYDASAFEPYSYTYTNSIGDEVNVGPDCLQDPDLGGLSGYYMENRVGNGTAVFVGTNSSPRKVTNKRAQTIGYVLLEAKKEAENGTYSFGFNGENYIAHLADGEVEDEDVANVSFENKISLKLTGGAPPTLASVSVDRPTIEYGSTETLTLTATSTSGKDITSLVTFGVKDPQNNVVTDISIAADGKFTIGKHGAGKYTVSAEPTDYSKCTLGTQTLPFTTFEITPKPITNPTVTVTGFGKGASTDNVQYSFNPNVLTVSGTPAWYVGSPIDGKSFTGKFAASTAYSVLLDFTVDSNYVLEPANGKISVTIDGVAKQPVSVVKSGEGKYTIVVSDTTASAETPTISNMAEISAIYDDKLSAHTTELNGTVTNAADDPVTGKFTWADNADETTVGTVGSREFIVNFTPDDLFNYAPTTAKVTVNVAKKQITFNKDDYAWRAMNGETTETQPGKGIVFTYDGEEHGIEAYCKNADIKDFVTFEYDSQFANKGIRSANYTAYATVKLMDTVNCEFKDAPESTRIQNGDFSIQPVTVAGSSEYSTDVRACYTVTEQSVALSELGIPADILADTNNRYGLRQGIYTDDNKILDGQVTLENGVLKFNLVSDLDKSAIDKTATIKVGLFISNYATNHQGITGINNSEKGLFILTLNVTIIEKGSNKNDKLKVTVADTVYGETVTPVFGSQPDNVTNWKYVYTKSDNAAGPFDNTTINTAPAGEYTLTVTCENATKYFIATDTFEIKPREITANDVTFGATLTYTGAPQTQTVIVTINGTKLIAGRDYTADPSGVNGETKTSEDSMSLTAPGTYTVTVTGNGNYKGTVEKTFTVGKASLKNAIVVTIAPVNYDGTAKTPEPAVFFNELKLTEGTDYELSYSNNTNVGTATITITAKADSAHFTGSTSTTFKITAVRIDTNKEIKVATIPDQVYNAQPLEPAVTVKFGDKTLVKGTDYTVTYKNNTNASGGTTASAIITGTGSFTSTKEVTFNIRRANLNLPSKNPVFTYVYTETGTKTYTLPSDMFLTNETNKSFTIESVVCTNNEIFKVAPRASEDGTVEYELNGEKGEAIAQITIKPNSNYNSGQFSIKIEVVDKTDVSNNISFPDGSAIYTGSGIKYEKATLNGNSVSMTYTYAVKDGGELKDGLPLTVGTYTVTASYEDSKSFGSKTATFSITKATPPTPAEVKVDGEDKTLKDLEDSMRKDLGKIEGEFTWRDSDGKELDKNTKIEANKEYEWIFTPSSSNYAPISGKTTPYVRDDLSWLPGVLGGGSTFNFRDVTRYDYFYNAVKWAAENGIASGTSRYTFSPDAVCTRAQTVTFLWRAAGSPMPSYRISPFTDVNYGDYYYNAVLWAVEQGITTGLTATTFGPDKTVTRGQVAMFLYRAASAVKPNITNSFTDVKSTAYNYDAILWAYDNRITTGTSTTTFSPDAFCTRAQIVTFLYRFYQGR